MYKGSILERVANKEEARRSLLKIVRIKKLEEARRKSCEKSE